MTMTSTKSVRGEDLEVRERVILAPSVGVFRPVAGDETDHADAHADGDEQNSINEGEVVGVVEARGQEVPVRSSFTGFLMGMLVHPGERVREGQPVAWLRVL